MKYFTSEAFFESCGLALLAVILICLGRFIVSRYFSTGRRQELPKWQKMGRLTTRIITALLLLIIFFLILSVNGIDAGRLMTNLGIFGVVLSFALQDILKDVIMGVTISFENYYKVGDVVEYKGEVGKVISFTMKTTKLYMTATEKVLSISNRNITEISIVSDWFDIDVPIGYDVDLHYSRSLCRECAKRIEKLRYVYSCDFINTQDLCESWATYRLRIHCVPEKKYPVRRNSWAVVQDVFYEHHTEFPLSIKVVYDKEHVSANDKQIHTTGKPLPFSSGPSKHGRDYELGRGAAASKHVAYDGSDDALAKAVKEADRYSSAENLSSKMRNRIQLLSEELLTMVRSINNMKGGEFVIERDDDSYELVFSANATISKDQRGRLVKVASSGKNEAYSGLGGLIRQAVDSMISMSYNAKQGIEDRSDSAMKKSIGKSEDGLKWSLKVFQETEMEDGDFENEQQLQTSLSKSLLTSLSDDIKISIRSNFFTIRVLVKSPEED